jgi:protein involved in polysaccharide export with SLBB domain
MTILDLLAEAGGPTSYAMVNKINVVNRSCCEQYSRTFNLPEFAKTADFSRLPLLRAGDTVYVPTEKEGKGYKVRQGIRDFIQAISLFALVGVL